MKTKISLSLISSLSVLLSACNSGGSSSPTPPTPTQYEFSEFSFTNSSSNCSGVDVFGTAECSANNSTVTFNISYSSNPASYLVIPTQDTLPQGITISTSGLCSSSAVPSYSCIITLTAESANIGTVAIPLNGLLGQENFITVNFQ